MTIELILNHKTFKFIDHDQLGAEWENVQRDSKWEGTGGDWREYARTIKRLFSEASQGSTGQWFSYWQPYNPVIAVRIVQGNKHE